jgi:hypothetical protein
MTEQVCPRADYTAKNKEFIQEHGSDAWSSCLQLQSLEFNEDS